MVIRSAGMGIREIMQRREMTKIRENNEIENFIGKKQSREAREFTESRDLIESIDFIDSIKSIKSTTPRDLRKVRNWA